MSLIDQLGPEVVSIYANSVRMLEVQVSADDHMRSIRRLVDDAPQVGGAGEAEHPAGRENR
ncbi:MAG TPA: hypothetical protein VGL39_17315 [Jatrophihabitantaceae bacterium]|jgi:hypothetical protein